MVGKSPHPVISEMKKLVFLLLLLLIQLNAAGQIVSSIANYRYRTLDYSGAIPLLTYLYQKDSMRVDVVHKLANSHRLRNNNPEATYYYGRLTQLDPSAEVSYRYASLLLASAQYDSLRHFLASAALLNQQDGRLESIRTQLAAVPGLLLDENLYVSIDKLAFNDTESAFGPMIWGDALVFVASKPVDGPIKRRHSWTDRAYVRPFISQRAQQFSSYASFKKLPRHRFNLGPASLAYAADSTLFYTINKGRKNKRTGYSQLQIVSARWSTDQQKWRKPQPFVHNLADYTTTHPYITPDGQGLYFSSNRPGGWGGMDIYYSQRLPDGLWSAPKNAGPRINSSADELFPFIDGNGKLYFSSNGWGSLGGLDIFEIELNDSTALPFNPGAPINSAFDDFSLIVLPGQAKGYFSSNRENAGMDDDIYEFIGFKPRQLPVQLYVIDSLSRENISQVVFWPHPDSSGIKLANGRSTLQLIPGQDYLFRTQAPNYKPAQKAFSMGKKDSVVVIEMVEQIRACIVQGTISDKITGAPIDSAYLVITRLGSSDTLFHLFTAADGFYRYISLPANQTFVLSVIRNGYFAQNIQLKTGVCKATKAVLYDYLRDFVLEPIIIGKAFKIDNIYFDLNKWNIRKDAAKELDKIVKILEDNPEIIIELSSHTDARGNDASNELLSDRRAKSSVAYIISKGISSSRITAKGYGETRLVNRCGNNVKCSEKEHQENRRTEFQVVGFL